MGHEPRIAHSGMVYLSHERRSYRSPFPELTLGVEPGASPPVGAPRLGPEGLLLLTGQHRSIEPLANALAERGQRVICSPDPSRALEDAEALQPDTLIVSEDSPGGRITAFLSVAAPMFRARDGLVLVLSRCSTPEKAAAILDLGAHDVVCPPHSASAILVRRHLLRKQTSPESNLRSKVRRVRLGHLTVDLTTRQVTDGDGPVTLSGREFELLVHLMEAGGEVVTREKLLEDIWGEDQDSAGVLDATIHRLRRKLDGKSGDGEVVATVRGIGYRLDAPVNGKYQGSFTG